MAIILGAKVRNVPSPLILERLRPLNGRQADITDGLRAIGQPCEDRGVDSYLAYNTRWLSNFGGLLDRKPSAAKPKCFDLNFPSSGADQINAEFHL